VIGSRQPRVTKPARMSLAQFTRNLTTSESDAPSPCAGGEMADPESVGQKRFAANVMVAMSKPTRCDGS
jgi:hypothetical protein